MIVEEQEKKLEPTDKVMKFSDVVKIKAKYPKDYAKKKHMEDGKTYEVHKLQADDLIKRGIAEEVK
jgi:hypothetical protein